MNVLIVLTMLLAQGFSTGPSTQSGDGISDGSTITRVVNGKTVVVPAPAPNSKDGIPDGSGF